MKNCYDSTVGYSSLEDIDRNKLQRLIAVNKRLIDIYYSPQEGEIILVAGAGLGEEAYQIHKCFQLMTIGVDINMRKNSFVLDEKGLYLQMQDLAALAFRDDSFSLIYCYHVLEHVQNHMVVLQELQRVLRPGGILFIGFPNKNRLISYIGTSQKVSFLEKLKWNANDFIYRFRGKFENKYGAHAGFSEKEYLEDSSKLFSSVYSVRNQYMLLKYSKFKLIIKILIRTKLAEIFFPSNYYICIKNG